MLFRSRGHPGRVRSHVEDEPEGSERGVAVAGEQEDLGLTETGLEGTGVTRAADATTRGADSWGGPDAA